ncbi:jg16593 [Pararge aegeria aegeria]|uniref:Jg16593 protein n=1 Tax=Pararge aegeria aegeria TaxID=348720 RepID=A0A8S4R9R0_9NEOP|nr:jg16593 [Pararge aegeria aegeria]
MPSTSKKLMGYRATSGSDFCERLEIETFVERVHAVIDRTHRALKGSRRAGQLSRRLRRTSRWHGTPSWLASPAQLAGCRRRMRIRVHCTTRSGSGLGSRRAHTHGTNESSGDDVHRGSRVLAARVSASD